MGSTAKALTWGVMSVGRLSLCVGVMVCVVVSLAVCHSSPAFQGLLSSAPGAAVTKHDA